MVGVLVGGMGGPNGNGKRGEQRSRLFSHHGNIDYRMHKALCRSMYAHADCQWQHRRSTVAFMSGYNMDHVHHIDDR